MNNILFVFHSFALPLHTINHPQNTMRKTLYTLLLLAFGFTLQAQQNVRYTETIFNQTDGLSENTVSRIIQDRMGFMWFATWNGLNRYDGRNFRCFKAEPGQACPLRNNRITWIGESDEDNIWCLSENHPYLFLKKEQRFVDVLKDRVSQPIAYVLKRQKGVIHFVSDGGVVFMVKDRAPYPLLSKSRLKVGSAWCVRHQACSDRYEYTYVNKTFTCRDLQSGARVRGTLPMGVSYVYSIARYDANRVVLGTDQGVYFYSSPSSFYPVPGWETQTVKELCVDRQKNIWLSTYPGITLLQPQHDIGHPVKLSASKEEFIRALYTDRQGKTWIADKNGVVRIVGGGTPRYLSASGQLQQAPCAFGQHVYCVFQDYKGNYWLGTKGAGIFRLTAAPHGGYSVRQFVGKASGLTGSSVYAVTEDDRHNLWIALYGGGIGRLVCQHGKERFVTTRNYFRHYPQGCDKVRCLYHVGGGQMLAGTMGGLVSFSAHERQPHFYLNTHNEQLSSLPNNDVMGILKDRQGSVWLATQGGGICRIEGKDFLSPNLRFSPVSALDGLASDVCLALSADRQGNLWVVSEMALTKYNPRLRKAVNFSIKDFGDHFIFSEVSPVLADGRMVVGTTQGTLTIDPKRLHKSSYLPEIALVRISVEGKDRPEYYRPGDTLTLDKDERNVVIDFSTLDYNRTAPILYRYMVEGVDRHWQVSDNPSLSLMNLPPGRYALKIMSTNGDGIWNSRACTLSIVVKPKFGETVWAKVLYSLLMILLGVAVIGIVRYIYSLRAQIEEIQLATNEKLERFSVRIQELLGSKPKLEDLHTDEPDEIISGQKQFTDRLMAYMNENIDNSELQVSDMASYMGMSKTLFYSKMKETLGCTPLNFINDLRIKRAQQLLSKPDFNVSSAAYACGFSDPHYFSRCFKKVVGCSPTEYMKNRGASKE